MCEFCTRHGEGRKWYLEARNYAAELTEELFRRRIIEHFFAEVIEKGNRQVSLMERARCLGLGLPAAVRRRITARQKESHFGQVVPLEEVALILSMATSVVRLTCGCRWARQRKESRLCFGLSLGPPPWYESLDLGWFGSPDLSRLEGMSAGEALEHIRVSDRQGHVHSVWTFGTPFIGALCNCELDSCLAMRLTCGLNAPVMFRGEQVAVPEAAACTGCKACVEKCQFRAIGVDGRGRKCSIDARRCYGCGVCRASCREGAIWLMDRRRHPVAAGLW